ncbi:MAG: helix-turn-helix domain-containing protein [Atopobiaceae bacterium]|nr:helix-turn-helix domain-containing protein [Atopobiaceae bacterium]
MARPRFSEMLIERRRQLGLTVQQAARVLRLKEEALIAFEEGDFPNIPKSGYAQGMLSSYARYLGLNPREVVDQFQSDLFENTNGMSSHELRRRTRESRGASPDDTGAWSARSTLGRSRTSVPEYRSLLQNPNSPLGSTDYFDTTSHARSRSESWQQGASRGGSNRSTYQSAYQTAREEGTLDEWEHPYPSSRSSRMRSTALQQRAITRGQNRPRAHLADPGAGQYGRQDVYQRTPDPNEYTDDLLLETQARPYEAASTRTGRKASQSINDAPQRPNVRRRTARSSKRDPRNRGARQGGSGGLIGLVEEFFSDPRRAAFVILGLLAVLLMVVIGTSISTCTSSALSGGNHEVPVAGASGTAETPEDQTATAEGDGETANADVTTDANTASSTSETTPTEVNVTVKVADGEVTWVEITKDGSSLVAETVTGPWEESYKVEKSMTIQVGDTSVVTVTNNGQLVRFEERASGVGTVTIQGPHFGEEEPEITQPDDESKDGEGEQGETDDSAQGETGEVVYGDDAGYYDENGVWQEGYADDWP